MPNAEEPPPEPARVATGRLPLQHQPVLLEAWQFVSRFGEPLLGLPPGTRLPSLQQLEAALLGEAPPPPAPSAQAEGQSGEASGEGSADGGVAAQPADAAVQLQVALVDFLVTGLFEGTAQAIIGERGAALQGRRLRMPALLHGPCLPARPPCFLLVALALSSPLHAHATHLGRPHPHTTPRRRQ